MEFMPQIKINGTPAIASPHMIPATVINCLAPGICGCNLKFEIFTEIWATDNLNNFCGIAPHVNATECNGRYVDTSSGNGLVTDGRQQAFTWINFHW